MSASQAMPKQCKAMLLKGRNREEPVPANCTAAPQSPSARVSNWPGFLGHCKTRSIYSAN